jgi:hypothetical protein
MSKHSEKKKTNERKEVLKAITVLQVKPNDDE